MLKHLKSIGAPEDVLREFERSSSSALKQQPDILDIDSLVALDELREQSSAMFADERQLKRMESQRRKQMHSSLCERCRSLRFENKPLET